jgi:integrase/recombinase XerD
MAFVALSGGRGRVLPKTISEKDFLEALKKVDKPKVKQALLLGFYECMRVSEVAALQPGQVDKDRGFIHILQAKGRKDRDIPIMPPVEKGLKYLPVGKDVRTLQRWSKAILGVKFHTLRHSGATYYLNEKKLGIRALQQLLGHSRLDTTQIYTHVTPDDLKKQFEEVWT